MADPCIPPGIIAANPLFAVNCLTVQPLPPLTVQISANPTAGNAPFAVTFSSSVTGGVPPYPYRWDFGDGGTDTAQEIVDSEQVKMLRSTRPVAGPVRK